MSVFYLLMRGITMIPKSLNVVVGSGNRANGDVKWMLFTQIIGSVFVVVAGYSLIYGFKLGVFSIYLTLFLDELIRAILNTIRFYKGDIFCSLPIVSLHRNGEVRTED
jgi:Na+-driven multidrug efflux pump